MIVLFVCFTRNVTYMLMTSARTRRQHPSRPGRIRDDTGTSVVVVFFVVVVFLRVCCCDLTCCLSPRAGEQPDLARALPGVLCVQDVATSAQQLLHQEQGDLLQNGLFQVG